MHPCLGFRALWLFALVTLSLAVPAFAQGMGTIAGRVYNPATQEYVRDAEVAVEGTNLRASTEVGGFFTLNNVPVGEVTVTVRYTGYNSVAQRVSVSDGQTATRDIELTPVGRDAAGKAGDTVELAAFVVASEREGNAKAIMSQRRNMNVSTSVASDIFGDVTDGNVGEFLKFLPGVDLDYVESETRGPRLGGMDAQYVGVSFDGIKLASADANRTGDLGRATSFEAFSISSIESIEISRTSSPDMDADSPAGTINMKTKRAFDRKGRRIGYNVSVNLNSEEFNLKETYGPDGTKRHKGLLNYGFDYSDVFFKQRLGIVLSHSHANSYTEQYRHNLTFNRTQYAGTTGATPIPPDSRPLVITSLNFKDGPKNIEKDTYTMTMDFKASRHLVLSLSVIYNYALGEFYNREFTFNASTNNTTVNTGRQYSLGDLNQVRTNGLANNTSRNVAIAGGNASKRTHTTTLVPRFEYKRGSWTVDGATTYSRSNNNYEALEQGHTRSEVVNNITSDFIATRSDINSREWTVQQTSGADWFNLANFTNPRLTNEGRYAFTEIYNGELNARWVTPFRRFPTSIKFGGKVNEEYRKNGNTTSYETWSYIGPGGNVLSGYNAAGLPTFSSTAGSWGAYPNAHVFDTGSMNLLTVKNIAGQTGMIPRPDPNAIATLFRDHPEWFVNNGTADNYYNAYIAPRRDMVQTVMAGYTMADIRFSSRLQVRTGIRWEDTESEFREYDSMTNREVLAAGFPVSTAGRPTTIAGYQYQYFTKPQITRVKAYDNFFPMISAKYSFSPAFQLQAGFNKAISRPPFDHITGAWLINEDTQRVTSPNPNLLPEYSKNFAARLAYYFEPAGSLSVSVAQNTIRNLREERTGTAEEFGAADDPEYANYTFASRFNIENPVRFRSLEIAYNQSLTFLPDPFRGLTATLSYTRAYASERRSRLAPQLLSTTLSYRYKRMSFRAGAVAKADTPWDDVYGRYQRHSIRTDFGGEFRLTKYASLYFQGRNIFNEPVMWYESPLVEGEAGALRILENYGANWVFGIKGTF